MLIKARKAISLVELIITLTIFAAVSMIAITGLINTMRASKKINAQMFLYTETQSIMDILAREIERSTIDYEAYYAREVMEEDNWTTDDYGAYAKRFYNPGTDGVLPSAYVLEPDYMKANCSTPGDVYPEDCPTETPVYSELDFDTGAHPYVGISLRYPSAYDSMNAFCAKSTSGPLDCTEIQHHISDELILINSTGDERTVFLQEAFEKDSTDYRLSKVKFDGSDSDGDGVIDKWVCQDSYGCTGGPANDRPTPNDLNNTDSPQTDFQPFSPTAITISDFYIFVAPTEDPYRAFAEENVQIQPQVTIVMTVSLSDDYGSDLLGTVPEITIQRTVSTGVYSEITSYE